MKALFLNKKRCFKTTVWAGLIQPKIHSVLKIKDLCKDFAFFFVLFAILVLAGCNIFADKRVVVKPEPVDTRDRWKVLAPFIKEYFETDMTVEEIAAELAYQEYILTKDKIRD